MKDHRCSPTVETVVNTMYAASETCAFYFDGQTGDVVCVEDPFDSDDPDETLEQLIEANPDRFALLPGEELWDESPRYARFARTLEEGEHRDKVEEASKSLHSRILFQDALRTVEQRAAWERFREQEYKALAIQWLRENGFIES